MEKDKRGKFIVLEGIDGSGKSTQMTLLANHLRAKGLRVYETCEPTNSPIGSTIRQMMTGRIEGNHETIAALFIADRLDHLLNSTNGILKKIEQGTTVISDRYYFSSYAYHSAHVDMDWVIQANSVSANLLRPDINLFLDLSPERSIDRLNKGRAHLELYENLESMKVIYKNYLRAFEMMEDVERVESVDANQSPEQISACINEIVDSLF